MVSVVPAEIVLIAVIVPTKSRSSTQTSTFKSVSELIRSADIRYTTGVVGWRISALQGALPMYCCSSASVFHCWFVLDIHNSRPCGTSTVVDR